MPLVSIPQGKIGYVYARDGEALLPSQTLGQVISCNNFQDARGFLGGESTGPDHEPVRGQRGRQRSILREGVYAINVAQFTVITEDTVYRLEAGGAKEHQVARSVAERPERRGRIRSGDHRRPDRGTRPAQSREDDGGRQPRNRDGARRAVAAAGRDHRAGRRVRPQRQGLSQQLPGPRGVSPRGGRRGLQYVPLTDGTYFINRWFASIESIPKMIVPIGYVGVVVSYYGRSGNDLSGQTFRHGERVAEGERGVQEKPLGPGKYAFNTYAGNIVLVPTTNFVLHWVTGRTETHRYDESLRSIDLVTKDAYEPSLPLSVVVHIDYQKAPNVIQRFGDVKKLITQTLDPMLSAYFRDVAHKRTMLELLQNRDSIQHEASGELGRKFHNFDIECVDVLIGKPDTEQAGGKIETLLEQLRLRQLSLEQVETYTKQVAAAQTLRTLNEAQAQAQMQTQLSNSMVQIKIAENEAEALLARARKQAEQVVVTAEAESEAAHPGRARRRRANLAGRFFGGVRLAAEDPVVFRPASVRSLDRGSGAVEVQPAARARAGVHLGRRGRDGQSERRARRTLGRSPGTASSGSCSTCWWPRNRASSSSISPAPQTFASSPSKSPSRRWKRSRKLWNRTAQVERITATVRRPHRRW